MAELRWHSVSLSVYVFALLIVVAVLRLIVSSSIAVSVVTLSCPCFSSGRLYGLCCGFLKIAKRVREVSVVEGFCCD
eukprot:2623408-Amphidinium_carterae.1